MTNLEVEYDLVVVVDCLPEKQKEKYKISSKLMTFLASKGIKQKVINCSSKKAVFEGFDYLNKLAKTNKFCLQIVSHGNNLGIGIEESGELITWKEFNNCLNILNIKLSNTLILNMTSCKGLYGIKINDDNIENYPFFGLIGCNRNLKVSEANFANELFYTKIMEGKDISVIIPEIQNEFKKIGKPDNIIFSISSEGYKKIEHHINKDYKK